MTLILSFVTTHYSLQVSDRLVTKGGSQFDSLANKSLVYSGNDCIVTMAYTGKAHIDGNHADDFIAAAIEPKCKGLESGAFFQGPNHHEMKCWDLGFAVKQICLMLESVSDPRFRPLNFEVTIAGWQGLWSRKKKPRPILIKLSKISNTCSVQLQNNISRHWHWNGRGFYLQASPVGHLKREEFDILKKVLGKIPKSDVLEHSRLVEKELIETIRMVSNRSPVVGENCMGVFLPHPLLQDVSGRILFSPMSPHYDDFVTLDERARLPVAYTPWMIGCNNIVTPMQLLGGPLNWSAGGYSIKFEGVPSIPPNSILAMSWRAANRHKPE